MITVKKNAIKYKDSDGTMKDSGVLCNVGTFGVDWLEYATQFTKTFNGSKFGDNADVCINYGDNFSGNFEGTLRESDVHILKIIGRKDLLITIPTIAYACRSLVEVDLTECSTKIKSINQSFGYCSALKEIKGELDFSEATSIGTFVQNANLLEEIRIKKETVSLTMNVGVPLLSASSIQSIIDSLKTVETTQTLQLHADVKAKLTEEQIATITSKNWTLA